MSLRLDSHETSFFSGLIPTVQPVTGTDTDRPLSVNLTLVVTVSSLLHAEEPLVVTIPAMKCLVLGRKTLVTRSSTDVLYLVQEILLLLAELWDLVAENLQVTGRGTKETKRTDIMTKQ